MSRIRITAIALLAVAALTVSTSSAQAGFVLRLTAFDTANVQNGQVTITDQDFVGPPPDGNGLAGVVTFSGSLGNFFVNTTTGLSKPIVGSSTIAQMDLNSVNVSSTAGGSILIELTDTGFGATGPGTLTGGVGGTIAQGGTGIFGAFKSLTNQEFSQANLAAAVALGTFSAGAFSDTQFDNHGAIANPYSMTLTAYISHSGGLSFNQNSSFNFDVFNSPVPEPATIISAILGLPALGGYLWRRRKMSADLAV